MAEVQTLPMSKPDIQIRLTWDEAVELCDAMKRMFGNNDLLGKLRIILSVD